MRNDIGASKVCDGCKSSLCGKCICLVLCFINRQEKKGLTETLEKLILRHLPLRSKESKEAKR